MGNSCCGLMRGNSQTYARPCRTGVIRVPGPFVPALPGYLSRSYRHCPGIRPVRTGIVRVSGPFIPAMSGYPARPYRHYLGIRPVRTGIIWVSDPFVPDVRLGRQRSARLRNASRGNNRDHSRGEHSRQDDGRQRCNSFHSAHGSTSFHCRSHVWMDLYLAVATSGRVHVLPLVVYSYGQDGSEGAWFQAKCGG